MISSHLVYPPVFTKRRYVSTVYAVIMCLSVRLSVCYKLEFYNDD